MITIEDLENAGLTDGMIVKILKLEAERIQRNDRVMHAKRQREYIQRRKMTLMTVTSVSKEGSPFPLEVLPSHLSPSDSPSLTLPIPNPLSLSKKTRVGPWTGQFNEFWAKYPEKVGKAAAETAYRAARTRTSHETIMAGLARYINFKPADRNWCHPRTWLSQDRWLDQPSTVPLSKAMQHIHEFIGGSDYDRAVQRQKSAAKTFSIVPNGDGRGPEQT